MADLSREALGLKIYKVTRNHADGYRRVSGSFATAAEEDINEKCACAASNTGYFILQALGYTKKDMDRFRELTGTANQVHMGTIK